MKKLHLIILSCVSVAVSTLVGLTCFKQGQQLEETKWKADLVGKDYAEYNRKTGEWQLRELSDIAEMQLLFGKNKYSEIKVIGVLSAGTISTGTLNSGSLSSEAETGYSVLPCLANTKRRK